MNSKAMAGFILAAGEGRRLRPASLLRPKALMPFCGVPMLKLAASQLAGLGVCPLIVNAYHLADQVERIVAELREERGWDLLVSRESALLGTGGGLRAGAPLAQEARHFFVHNADVILDFPLERLLEAHFSGGAIVTALLVPGRGPCTLDIDAQGRITQFRKPHGTGQFTFAGVYLLRREILDFLPKADPCSIIDACEAAGAAGFPSMGLSTGAAYWSDLGAPNDYIHAHAEVADCGLLHHPLLREAQAEQARRRAALERVQGVKCTGAIGLGADLVLPPGTHLHNVVAWDETRIARPYLYADSIFIGEAIFPPTVNDRRRPDPRIYAALGVAPEDCRIQDLRKQGSGRRYACIHGPEGKSWVWCAYSPERRENSAFAAVSEFLARVGVRVPRVIVHLGDACELVSDDLGRQSLQDLRDPAAIEQGLADVVEQIARLHVIGNHLAHLEELPLQAGFTKGLYDWERDYFREHILGKLLNQDSRWSKVAEEYCLLRNRLLAEPIVPIHRDLQSANIMILDGQAFLIDFQGMRPGCAAYDLGSLLFDPYMSHPPERRAKVWEVYKQAVVNLGGTPPEDALLGAAASQRLLQALGAYGKLWLGDGLPWYRRFILPALDLLAEAAEAAKFPCLAALARDVKDAAAPKIGTQA